MQMFVLSTVLITKHDLSVMKSGSYVVFITIRGDNYIFLYTLVKAYWITLPIICNVLLDV